MTIFMCLSPITLPNPNFGLKHLGLYRDVVSSHIQVPCGSCSQCCAQKQNGYVQRLEMDMIDRDVYFMTLTYSNSGLLKTDTLDYQMPYACYDDFQQMLKRYRKQFKGTPLGDIRYLAVNEYGSKSYRPHFHVLFSVPKEYDKFAQLRRTQQLYDWFKDNWKRNVNYDKKTRSLHPIWQPVYEYRRRGKYCSFDLHLVSHRADKKLDSVPYYVTKYVLKYDSRTRKLCDKIKLDKRLSDEQRKLLLRQFKPRVRASKSFGRIDSTEKYDIIADGILSGLQSSTSLAFSYFSPNSGRRSLLCESYRKQMCTEEVYLKQREILGDRLVPGSRTLRPVVASDEMHDYQLEAETKMRKQSKFEQTREYLNTKHITYGPEDSLDSPDDMHLTTPLEAFLDLLDEVTGDIPDDVPVDIPEPLNPSEESDQLGTFDEDDISLF